MSDDADLTGSAETDAGLIEYVLVTLPLTGGLDTLVPAVLSLVEKGAIRLIDVVALQRSGDQATVTVREVGEIEALSALVDVVEPEALFSEHDVELAASTLEPDASALLLLLEDRWASPLSAAARQAGGRIAAGERVVRRRDPAGPWKPASRARRKDLLARSPSTAESANGEVVFDRAAQLRTLAHLVEIGVLSLEQYEAQRRRAVDG